MVNAYRSVHFSGLALTGFSSRQPQSEVAVFRGTWVTQSDKHPTLGFGSGHDLRVVRSSLTSGSALGVERFSLSRAPGGLSG